jgi:hypothetical protein
MRSVRIERDKRLAQLLGATLAFLWLAAGCTQQGQAPEASQEQSTPSAMDHTYHGEAIKARARAMRTLEGVNAERKEREKEEKAFDRPASPTPSENP